MGGEVDGRQTIVEAIQERAQRGVDIVKIMASGGMTTPGTDVMSTQFTRRDQASAGARSGRAAAPRAVPMLDVSDFGEADVPNFGAVDWPAEGGR